MLEPALLFHLIVEMLRGELGTLLGKAIIWAQTEFSQTVLETLDGVEHVRATATLGNATTFFLALRVQFP